MSEDKQVDSAHLAPGLPPPAPICSDVPDTWAHRTVTIRLPDIARRTLTENDFAPIIASQVKALIDEIPQEPIRFLEQPAPDAALWAEAARPHLGQNWLQPPWFFVETYFYRRLLEATGYFSSATEKRLDPFAYQKREGLQTTRPKIHAVSELLSSWEEQGGSEMDDLAALLAINLWGNRADLSLWPVDAGDDQPLQAHWQGAEEHTLVDDTPLATRHVRNHAGGRIDFMVDNAGLELVTDLALADYLLATGLADQVRLHLKIHPTFVSDATIKDGHYTIRFLAVEKDEATAAWGKRLLGYLDEGRLQLRDHPFWTSPFAFWQLPDDLRVELSEASLIISKGDANYRRLLGDRHWPYTASFQAIMRYTPAPLLALRALKSELAVGLTVPQIERLIDEDPEWLVNGRWGVIQFVGSV